MTYRMAFANLSSSFVTEFASVSVDGWLQLFAKNLIKPQSVCVSRWNGWKWIWFLFTSFLSFSLFRLTLHLFVSFHFFVSITNQYQFRFEYICVFAFHSDHLFRFLYHFTLVHNDDDSVSDSSIWRFRFRMQ